MQIVTVLGICLIAGTAVPMVLAAPYLLRLFRTRLLYRRVLSKEEQAFVEKNLDRLTRVIVMCDRVDKPEHGFLKAVQDNFRGNVRYHFLVSNGAADEELSVYREMFDNIEKSVRYEQKGFAVTGAKETLGSEPLYEVTKLNQEWNDYPYICYEFVSNPEDSDLRYLMYRGSERGVGIAPSYVKISPETAYSLVKRGDALKALMGANELKFVDSQLGGLGNIQANENVVLLARSGTHG